MTELLLLALVVFGAVTIASAIGFGSMILTVIFASQLVPLDLLLSAMVPINLLLSAWIALKERAHIDWPLTLRRVLPWMGAGVGVGLLLYNLQDDQALKLWLGVVVLALSLRELWRAHAAAPNAPLHPLVAAGALVSAGVVHGLFASGGPLLVYMASRALPDKRRFRATLSAVWILMNGALLVSYALTDRFSTQSAWTSLALLPGSLLGIWIGERLHHRIDATLFRKIVFTMLTVGAVALIARSWPA
jgi:uncharacterized membrane protein YfcA